MIQPNELRIGNYVRDRGGKRLRIDYWESPNRVAQKSTLEGIIVHPYTEDVDHLEPIPLTEQWLLKFGFENRVNSFKLHDVEIDNDFPNSCWIHTEDDAYHVKNIKYVHQLQNLYFALTGTELTIKE